MRLVLMISVAAGLCACNSSVCHWGKSDADLLEEYSRKSLRVIYKDHVSLASKCTPPRLTLASALAPFGADAKLYALHNIRRGNLETFLAASSTISAVNTLHGEKCSPQEFRQLIEAARNLNVLAEARRIYEEQAAQACRY